MYTITILNMSHWWFSHTNINKILHLYITRKILRPLSALSMDEVNIAKRNITTGLFGLTQVIHGRGVVSLFCSASNHTLERGSFF